MIAWNKRSADQAMALVEQLRLNGQEPDESWTDVMPRWERADIASVLGLPGAKGADKGLMEICGCVGMGKDQIMGGALLALAVCCPAECRVVVWSTQLAKSREVQEAARGFVARDRILELERYVAFTRDELCSKDGRFRALFLSMDKNTAVGTFYDYALMNEVQDWEGESGREVFEHTLMRVNKRKGRFVAFTNAPYTPRGEWRRDRFEQARRAGSDWHFRLVTVDDCKWIDRAHLALLRRNLPEEKIKRLYWCVPSDGAYSLIAPEVLRRAEIADLCLATGPTRLGRRFAGIDLGVKRDHAVIALLCLTPREEVFLERLDVWNPANTGGEVSLDEVEALALHYGRTWRAEILPDPWNARQLIQHLQQQGVRVREVPPIPANQDKMARSVISLFMDGRVRMPPEVGKTLVAHVYGRDDYTSLAAQILGAEVEDRASGLQLAVKRNRFGHGDQLMAFALAAYGLVAEGYGAPAAFASSELATAGARAIDGARGCAGAGLRARHGSGVNTHLGLGRTRDTWRSHR